MSINNYIKTVSKQPTIALYLDKSSPFAAPPRYFEEYWFFDDTDPASVNVAITKMQSFRGRQPNGTRFQTSVWRSVAAAREIPEVGEPPRALKRVA